MQMSNKTQMNEELQQWIKDTKAKVKKDKNKQKPNKKPLGMCQICGEKPSQAVCIKCGKNVCKACYFKLISICKKCVQKKVAGKWDGSHPEWEEELGVDWVD